ncbi:occludin/ELL domain-containing protein 1 [Tachyglossus aculeatus]|uniref:occludin/ELL domain-containing protein 1 n=1 Tax=Tachyglossus aculeatus TaxID=9261 RepID=UPI0018F76EE9|nr:occludin/ELL domain-containing protein 1 [Tachyglossus aculeatus]XP_038595864.1 occludin/ELL domain-containing protein 1 [Tachyglossus aculeatus]
MPRGSDESTREKRRPIVSSSWNLPSAQEEASCRGTWSSGDPPCSSRPSPQESVPTATLKPIRRFVPRSWKDFFSRGRRSGPEGFPPITYFPADTQSSLPSRPILAQARSKRIVFEDELPACPPRGPSGPGGGHPGMKRAAVPRHDSAPPLVPDYVLKYPAVGSTRERAQFKAVFNDQYAEYRELHAEVSAGLHKFQELEAMMAQLPRHSASRKEEARLARVRREYEKKRKDPTFLEKQERCRYLQKKLQHLKVQIQKFDEENRDGSVYF